MSEEDNKKEIILDKKIKAEEEEEKEEEEVEEEENAEAKGEKEQKSQEGEAEEVEEEEVEVDIQRLAQVGAGILPHLEDGGRRKEHDVRDLLAGDRVRGLGGGGGDERQRQRERQNQCQYLFHGRTSFFLSGNRPLCCSTV